MSQRTAGNPPKKWTHSSLAATSAPSTSASSSSSNASSSSPSSSVSVSSFPLSLVAKILGWGLGWYLSCKIEFGAVYLVVSAIYLIFTNLSSESSSSDAKNKKLSAYSVFNTGAKRIAGSMDAESFENEIRHRQGPKKTIDLDIAEDENSKQEHYQRKSKAANQPCVCGSGKKYKNCCSPLTASAKEEEAEWQAYEKEWMNSR